jgi:hypothetical protein
MAFNLRLIGTCFVVVIIAVFVLFYIFDNLGQTILQCQKDKSLKICKTGILPIVLLMLLLIAGGLIVVVNITAYILLSGAAS